MCEPYRLVLFVAVEDLVEVGRDALRRRPEGAPPAAAPAAEAAAPARHTVDPEAEAESGEEVVTAAAAAVVSRRGRRGATSDLITRLPGGSWPLPFPDV